MRVYTINYLHVASSLSKVLYEKILLHGQYPKSRGLMDKAPAYGAGDCGFKSRRDCLFCFAFNPTNHQIQTIILLGIQLINQSQFEQIIKFTRNKMVETKYTKQVYKQSLNQKPNSDESKESQLKLDHSDQKSSEANPENYLKIHNMPILKENSNDSLDFDQVMVPGSIVNGNNQIDINQNLHPFNHKNQAERIQFSKSNYVTPEEYKPFEVSPDKKERIEYHNSEGVTKITYCTFNQDFSLIAIGTEKHGFSIYQANPLTKVYQSKPKEDECPEEEIMVVVCVEMQFTSNILALVQTTQEQAESDALKSSDLYSGERFDPEGQQQPQKQEDVNDSYVSGLGQKMQHDKEEKRRRRRCKSSKRELIIWDTTRQEAIMTIKFFQKIIGIKMNLKHIITISKDKVYIHDLEGMIFVQKLDLHFHMSRVVLSPNISRNKPLLFYSDSTDFGELKTYNIQRNKVVKSIMAHNTAILKIACDLEGYLVITNSTHGDVIRLWSTDKGQKLATFRQRPYTELNCISIGQSGLVSTFSETGYLDMFTMPDEAIDCIQSSSQYSFQSSVLESDFMSNDVFNSLEQVNSKTTEEKKSSQREKESFTTFCGHLKQSFLDCFGASSPVESMQITFEGQSDQNKSLTICGSSNDGRKVFAFDQTSGNLVTVIHNTDEYGNKQKPTIGQQSIFDAPTHIIPKVIRNTQTLPPGTQYQSLSHYE